MEKMGDMNNEMHRYRYVLCIGVLTIFYASSAKAEISEGAIGLLLGNGVAYTAVAPSGWVWDNESGVKDGLLMMFYPKKEKWDKSPVLVYGKAFIKTDQVKTIDGAVNATVNYYKENGNPNYSGTFWKEIKQKNNKILKLYKYQGDEGGTYEVTAYADEEFTINYLSLHANTEKAYANNIKTFENVVKTYRNVLDSVVKLPERDFAELQKKTEAYRNTPEWNEHKQALQAVYGEEMKNASQQCLNAHKDESNKPYSILMKIPKNSTVPVLFVNSDDSLPQCYAIRLALMYFSSYQGGDYWDLLALEPIP